MSVFDSGYVCLAKHAYVGSGIERLSWSLFTVNVYVLYSVKKRHLEHGGESSILVQRFMYDILYSCIALYIQSIAAYRSLSSLTPLAHDP